MAVAKKKKKTISIKKKSKPVKKPSKLKKRVTVKKPLKKTTGKVTKKKSVPALRSNIKKVVPGLRRHPGNPIIEPDENKYWESKATFNPSAIIDGDTVHLVYRAIGDTDVSTLGYATSKDGYNFEKQSEHAIYAHSGNDLNKSEPLTISYLSGGGWSGGCEDPRLVKIGDTVYMTYTAFDGWNSVRIALTSIKLTDLKNKKWNWKIPVLISPQDEVNKNWVIFPEKINGKYAVLHSISPHILIDYVADLNSFDGKDFINSIHRDNPSWGLRDKGIRGVGPAPIRTKSGWLVLYHGTEPHEGNKYKLWAMLLDLKDPTKIVYKTKKPILEPEEEYETAGYMGIIYSCGAIVKDGTLFVYYGGGDKVGAVATANLEKFLKEIISSGTPKLSPPNNSKKR
jgi:predicted GH43/DUF377 family glycosyl hydrolase